MWRLLLRTALRIPALWLMAVAGVVIFLRPGSDKLSLFVLIVLTIGGAFELQAAFQAAERGEGRSIWGWRVASALGTLLAAYALLGAYKPGLFIAGVLVMVIASHVHFRRVMSRATTAA